MKPGHLDQLIWDGQLKIHNKEQLRYKALSDPKRCWASMILGRISELSVCGGKMLSKRKENKAKGYAAAFDTQPLTE